MNSLDITKAYLGEGTVSKIFLGTVKVYPPDSSSKMPAPAYTVPEDEIWYIPEDGRRDSWLTTGKAYYFANTAITMISETMEDNIIKCKFSDTVDRVFWDGTKNVSIHFSSAVSSIFNFRSGGLIGTMKYVKSINSLTEGVYNTLNALPGYYSLYQAPCTTLHCYWGASDDIKDWVPLRILDNCKKLSTIYNYAPYPLHPLGSKVFTDSGAIFNGGVLHCPAEHADYYQSIWMEGKGISSGEKYMDALATDYSWTLVADL